MSLFQEDYILSININLPYGPLRSTAYLQKHKQPYIQMYNNKSYHSGLGYYFLKDEHFKDSNKLIERKWIKSIKHTLNGPRQANLCLRAFRHDKL